MSEQIKAELVYLGYEVSFGKVPHKFHAYTEPDNVQAYLDGKMVAKWYKKMLARTSVGAVILCEATQDEKHFTIHGEPKFVRLLDWNTRMLLEAKSEAAIVQYDAEYMRKKAENENALELQLAPVKNTFNKMKSGERKAFIAWLLVYLNA